MFPSGPWSGIWQQEGWGRQPMWAFQLKFQKGSIKGSGSDVIGSFAIFGEWDSKTGSMRFAKKYTNAHTVIYNGKPDGEGGITGTWIIQNDWGKNEGSFSLKPILPPATGREKIRVIRPQN